MVVWMKLNKKVENLDNFGAFSDTGTKIVAMQNIR